MSDSVIPRTVACLAPLSIGILQARIQEWVAMPSSRGSSQTQDQTQVSHIAGTFFTIWATREPKNTGVGNLSLLQGIFPNQESNWGLLHCRWILYQLGYQGSPILFLPTSKNCLFSSSVLDLVMLVDWMVKWYEQKLGRWAGRSECEVTKTQYLRSWVIEKDLGPELEKHFSKEVRPCGMHNPQFSLQISMKILSSFFFFGTQVRSF